MVEKLCILLPFMYMFGSAMKKIAVNVCRDCGNQFRGQTGSYRCPECRKKEIRYKQQREKMRRSLPFYLKTDI